MIKTRRQLSVVKGFGKESLQGIKAIDGLHVTSCRPCWWTETFDFSPLGVRFHFYANFVNKFSFVLSTNMAAMQTSYRALSLLQGLHVVPGNRTRA